MRGKSDILDTWAEFRNLSRQEIIQWLSAQLDQVQHDLKYEKLAPVDKIYCPEKHPGHFYFKGDRLVMLYVGQCEEINQLKCSDLIKKYGEPTKLKSRAGKVPHYVHPEKGVAYSVKGEHILFVEIFPPCSLKAYMDEIYKEPAPFRK